MAEQKSFGRTPLSSQAFDQICDEFEALWKAGRPRPIEEFVDPCPAADRPRLLTALLEIELEYLLPKQSPQEDDYLKRFPREQECVHTAFETFRERFPDRFAGTHPESDATTAAVLPQGRPSEFLLPYDFGDRYTLIQLLGGGGMGEVYRAFDKKLHKEVALKIPRFDSEDPNQASRFVGEARAAAKVEHPGICPVYDIADVSGRLYITMKLIEGKSLEKLLNEGRTFSTRQSVAIVRKAAEALAVAHQKNVIHRDIKPANIMLTPQGEALVVDFGLALNDATSGERLTRRGDLLGTPAYMPIEQATGDLPKIDQRTDVYSLTAVLFRLLAGRAPYRGSALAIVGQIQAAARLPETRPSLAAERSDLDAQLVKIVERGMAFQMQDRYPSMQALADDLKDYQRTLIAAERSPSGSDLQSVNQADVETIVPGGSSQIPRNPRRHYLVATACLLPLLWWLATVFLVRTENGTLKIEVSDPRIQVLVDGNVITIDDADRKLELTAGPQKKLIIKSNDLQFEVEKEFSLKKSDGEKRLHVVLLENGQPDLREGAMPEKPESPVTKERSTPELKGLAHFMPLAESPPEPSSDGSTESVRLRRAWYLNFYLSAGAGQISRQALASLKAPPEDYFPVQPASDLLHSVSEVWNSIEDRGRLFRDLTCSTPLGEEQLETWSQPYFRGYYSKAGHLTRVQLVPSRDTSEPPTVTDIVYAYDSKGFRTLEASLAVNRMPVADRDHFAITTRFRHANGAIETRYYDATAHPIEDTYGAHRRIQRSDGIVLQYHLNGLAVDDWLPVLNLGKRINAEHAWHPCFTPDGKGLYFATGYTGAAYDFPGVVKRSVWSGHRWTDPETVICDGKPLKGLRPTISPDSKILIVVAWKDAPYLRYLGNNTIPDIRNYGGADFYVASAHNGGWTGLRNLSSDLNSENEEGGCTLTGDGQTMLIARNSPPQPFSMQRIFRAAVGSNGQCIVAENDEGLGFGQEPSLDLKSGRLYFARSEPFSDLYYADPVDGGTGWSVPRRLPNTVNKTLLDDARPAISPDGNVLYFSRCFRPWELFASGKVSSEVAIRHLAEIFAHAEWETPGPGLESEAVAPRNIADLIVE